MTIMGVAGVERERSTKSRDRGSESRERTEMGPPASRDSSRKSAVSKQVVGSPSTKKNVDPGPTFEKNEDNLLINVRFIGKSSCLDLDQLYLQLQLRNLR